MFPQIQMVKIAIERLFNASASIYILRGEKDAYGITRGKKETFVNIRCRVSYDGGIASPASMDIVDTSRDTITMIYDGSWTDIPEGSLVNVTWDDGRKGFFENTSWPKVYSHHAEISLRKAKVHP